MLKKTLLTLAVFTSLVVANTANAELGWTLAQAEAYWGNPTHISPDSTFPEIRDVNWFVQDYRITGMFQSDHLIGVMYYREQPIDAAVAESLIARHLPNANWKEESRPDRLTEWDAFDTKGTNVGFAILGKDGEEYRLQICFEAMHELLEKRDSNL